MEVDSGHQPEVQNAWASLHARDVGIAAEAILVQVVEQRNGRRIVEHTGSARGEVEQGRARPVLHRKQDSIDAHLSVAFAALVVARYLEDRTGISPSSDQSSASMLWLITFGVALR